MTSTMTPPPVRRVITGHAPDKKAIVVADGAATIINAKEQSASTTVWSSLAIPVAFESEGFTVDPATHHKGSPRGPKTRFDLFGSRSDGK